MCNKYAPNDNKSKKTFFNSLQNILETNLSEQQLKRTLFLDDFNCVVYNKIDIISGELHSTEVIKCFNNLLSNLNINDIWHINHPYDKDYTWSGNKPVIARRLDYIFCK